MIGYRETLEGIRNTEKISFQIVTERNCANLLFNVFRQCIPFQRLGMATENAQMPV